MGDIRLMPNHKEASQNPPVLDKYDYIRLTFHDLNGIPRSMLLNKGNMKQHLKKGVECLAGAIILGTSGEVVTPREVKTKFGSGIMMPDYDTIHDFYSRTVELKIGQVLSEIHWTEDSPILAGPRYVARKQLQNLQEEGYSLLAGTEWEFALTNKSDGKPIFSGDEYMCSEIYGEQDQLFFELNEALVNAGVPVYLMHPEHSPGQLEISTGAEFGIKSADNSAICKQIIKEVAASKGYQANFMAVPFMNVIGASAHLNFSIWNQEHTKNLFFGGNHQDGISDFARHWIAGIMDHAPALTALCCPTTNCYRLLHNTLMVPSFSDWGFDNRTAMLRVKSRGPQRTLMENRLPSGLANPYLALAGTIAAGLDGVKNSMQCPDPCEKGGKAAKLPETLDEALKALKDDNAMVEALGEDFVDWFIMVKQPDLQAIKKAPSEVDRHNIEVGRYLKRC